MTPTAPPNRYAELVDALRSAVLRSPGDSTPQMREDAFHGRPVSPQLDAYIAKVSAQSYRVTDEDIPGLLRAGYSEDAIFEITVATALAAAWDRLAAGLGAMGVRT